MTDLFDPTPQGPASYPEDLPFVPGTPAMIGGVIETIPPSRADGWVAEGEPKAFGSAGPVLEMRRASATRHVSAVANGVFVLQTDSASM